AARQNLLSLDSKQQRGGEPAVSICQIRASSPSMSGGNGTSLHPAWMRGITITFYATIGLMGTLGNALVVFVVLRKRSMQTITNIFITNMAISDIIMSTLNVPLTPAAMFMDSWTLPSLVCKLMPMTMGVSVYVSSLTSTAIAIDRYFVIVH
uniref:G_PROTEIN_RECEP_F1_2 domain-containing protein n=1 Tax=Macrostomum lignano TaxID=282301 RepID=A0A1I8JIE4_9PLAT